MARNPERRTRKRKEKPSTLRSEAEDVARYLPIAMPLIFLALKHTFSWAVGWAYLVSPAERPSAQFSGEILFPSDVFVAGLVFDISMLTMFFRCRKIPEAAHIVPGTVALACVLMILILHSPLALASLRWAMQYGPQLASFGWEFWSAMFASAIIAFSVPVYLVR